MRVREENKKIMDKFGEFEEKLTKQSEEKERVKVISEERLKAIKNTFNLQITRDGEEDYIGIKKFQELLLNFKEGKKLTEEDIGEPLYVYYNSLK